MTDPVTNNRSLTQPTVGGDAGTWGGLLNTGTIGQLDLVLGNTQSVTLTSADATLSQVQWNNLAQTITGTFTGSRNLYLPLSPNSTTAAVGGLFVVENNSTGSFNLTVSTTASGATGVVAYNGLRSLLYSDQTNVKYADDSAARFTPTNGNPNGILAGTAATINNPPHPLAFDYSGGTGAWVPTTTGTSTSTVWAQLAGIGASLPVPEGYLTPVSGTPVVTSDSIGATVIYYTPFQGTWSLVHNGAQIIPYQFSQMPLTLTTSQAASNIYDIFLAYNGGAPVIGTGPSWSAGTGGSITAGSCARGTGVGGTALSRLQGAWTNTAQISLIYNTGSGNNTITVPANQGIYLGSIFVDVSAGQVTCHRSYGQSRKFGIWNPYNRTPIYLKGGDPTSSWTVGAGPRPANNNSANSLSAFTGLPEEIVDCKYTQSATAPGSGPSSLRNGIGYNSTSAYSGKQGAAGNNSGATIGQDLVAEFIQTAPGLGIQTVTAMESQSTGGTFQGTEANMLLSAFWRG